MWVPMRQMAQRYWPGRFHQSQACCCNAPQPARSPTHACSADRAALPATPTRQLPKTHRRQRRNVDKVRAMTAVKACTSAAASRCSSWQCDIGLATAKVDMQHEAAGAAGACLVRLPEGLQPLGQLVHRRLARRQHQLQLALGCQLGLHAADASHSPLPSTKDCSGGNVVGKCARNGMLFQTDQGETAPPPSRKSGPLSGCTPHLHLSRPEETVTRAVERDWELAIGPSGNSQAPHRSRSLIACSILSRSRTPWNCGKLASCSGWRKPFAQYLRRESLHRQSSSVTGGGWGGQGGRRGANTPWSPVRRYAGTPCAWPSQAPAGRPEPAGAPP